MYCSRVIWKEREKGRKRKRRQKKEQERGVKEEVIIVESRWRDIRTI